MSDKHPRQVTATSSATAPGIPTPTFDVASAAGTLATGNLAALGAAAAVGVSNAFHGSLRGGGDAPRTDRRLQEKARGHHDGRGQDTGNANPGDDGEHAWLDEVDAFEDPEIRHDQGHLEGWDDRNGNGIRDEEDWRQTRTGEIDESLRESATLADYALLAKWIAMLEGAELLRPDLVDATATYRHFLFGNGALWTFSYDRFLQNDSAGRLVEESAIADAEYAVLSAHDTRRFGEAPAQTEPASEQGGEEQTQGPTPEPPRSEAPPGSPPPPMSFRLQSAPVTVGAGSRYPYPGTENWQKAIGGHPMWLQTDATVTPDPTANERTLVMDLTLKMEDMYNFNPGQADITTGTPDAENGRLEVVGLGNEFLQRGEAQRRVEVVHPLDSWDRDEEQGGVGGAPERAEQRLPGDSRGNPGAR